MTHVRVRMRLSGAMLMSAIALSPGLAQDGVTLPVGQNLHPRPEQAADVMLEINATGFYALNGNPVTTAQFAERLGPLMRRSRDRVLYVRADTRLRSALLDSVNAIAASGGACVVSLVATQRPGTVSLVMSDSAGYIPANRGAIDVQLPIPRAPQATIARQQASAIVIEVLPGPAYRINTQPVTPDHLWPRLVEIYNPRPVKLVYMRADPTVAYGDVFSAIDVARAAGIVDIIAAPPELATPSGLPRIDLSMHVTNQYDSAAERIDGNIGRCRRGDVYSGRSISAPVVYFEFQVEKPATALQDSVAPRYPDEMRASHTKGEVLAQFVVDTTGRVLPETFKVLKSTHDLFTQAVMNALPGMRFTPATIAGVPVRQLVQRPFYFSVTP